MQSLITTSVAVAALLAPVAAVTGSAEGFADGVTGGGDAPAVYPESTEELISYLGDDEPRNIVLTQTFDFKGTEGTVNEQGCAPWGTGAGCQLAINLHDWCTEYQADAPSVSVEYDQAGVSGITVKSNKSLVGEGDKGVIKGKGLRISGGESNIIIQNIHVTDLNPQYVWGGDAITLDGADMVWIDHVTTSLVGRQHIVLGEQASGRVTISNSELNGQTDWSATCDGRHYWTTYFTGSDDRITFKGNYIHHTSGRAPKIGGNTLLHAVNNFWDDNSGQAFETDSGAMVLAEGNAFQNVKAAMSSDSSGQMFAPPDADSGKQCAAVLGRDCESNTFSSSGPLQGSDAGFLSLFEGSSVASVSSAEEAKGVVNTAGFGKI